MLRSLIGESIQDNLGIEPANAIRHGLGSARPPGAPPGARVKNQEGEEERKMKSAYELAMERLEKSAPSVALTENQKKELAEIDSVYRAKIAEKELFLKDQMRKAQVAGKFEEVESLDKQLASEIRRLHEECAAKKQKLRAKFARS
jgi:hypothetical protein